MEDEGGNRTLVSGFAIRYLSHSVTTPWGTCYLVRSDTVISVDPGILLPFGLGCAALGFGARWVAVSLDEYTTRRRELQANCDHTWGPILYHASYPTRHCKWCNKQQIKETTDPNLNDWKDW